MKSAFVLALALIPVIAAMSISKEEAPVEPMIEARGGSFGGDDKFGGKKKDEYLVCRLESGRDHHSGEHHGGHSGHHGGHSGGHSGGHHHSHESKEYFIYRPVEHHHEHDKDHHKGPNAGDWQNEYYIYRPVDAQPWHGHHHQHHHSSSSSSSESHEHHHHKHENWEGGLHDKPDFTEISDNLVL